MEDVVRALLGTPVTLDHARAEAPAAAGLYAWWAPPGALPGIAGPGSTTAELELLYVGIAPSGATSAATLRTRLVRNHIQGTTGQSTLRRSLAALLSEEKGWASRWTTRPLLVAEDEARLSRWMGETLRLTWAEHPTPWTVEAAVIEWLQPPLNQADNQAHPLYGYVRAARTRWREDAAGRESGA